MMKRCASDDVVGDDARNTKAQKVGAASDESNDGNSSDGSEDQSWEPPSDDGCDGGGVSSGYVTRSKGLVPSGEVVVDREEVYKPASDSSSSASSDDESEESSDCSDDDESDTEDDEYSDDDSFVTSDEDAPAALVRCDAGIVEIPDIPVDDSTPA